ncbi:hypothetical protein BV20DRAFT_967458 [Pilatotrama ljubarskyi]|nr:hypothetical protein BV20DRAFT_967458 [Pilatotrama ljubarskyi]
MRRRASARALAIGRVTSASRGGAFVRAWQVMTTLLPSCQFKVPDADTQPSPAGSGLRLRALPLLDIPIPQDTNLRQWGESALSRYSGGATVDGSPLRSRSTHTSCAPFRTVSRSFQFATCRKPVRDGADHIQLESIPH